MPLTVANTATATLAANAAGSGQIAYFDPITPAGLATGNAFVDMGLFPEGTRIAPTAEVTREDLRAAGRESGVSILVSSVVTDGRIGYEIPVLTPDNTVRALHSGASPIVGAGAGLVGVTAYQISLEAKVTGRFVFVKRRPTGPHTVIFHPRFELSSNGTENGPVNTEIFRFIGSVTSFPTYTPGADLAEFATAIGEYGVMFTAPDDATLDALLTALQDEAVA